MRYILCTDKTKIAKAQRAMLAAVKKGSERLRRPLGTRAGSGLETYYWRSDLELWVVENELSNRYWNAFGIDDPTKPVGVSIICEVNFPYDGVNRRIAAVFVEDAKRNLYVAHSGKIGGGREGIGKLSFWEHFRGGKPAPVTYPDGEDSDFIVLGRIGDKHLPQQLALFIHEVARIKALVASGAASTPRPSDTTKYTPEFAGKRKSYPLGGIVQSESYHGLVVDALAKQLETAKVTYGNDGARDMFIRDHRGRVTVLFEVKTDLSTTSTYGAVGQLMFHGAQADKPPRRVVVLPAVPDKRTKLVLTRLSIDTVSYQLDNGHVRFSGLTHILGSKG